MRLNFKGREKTEEQIKAEALKAREKQRKNLILTKYGQKQKRHSRQGVESCFCAAMSAFLIFLLLVNAFAMKGQVTITYGFLALIALFVAIIGIYLGVNGFKERDKNYLTCKCGIAICAIVALIMVAIFIRGLF